MLEHSTLMNEVTAITGGGITPVHFMYTANFVLPDGRSIAPLKFVGLDILRDYTANFSDITVVTLVVGAGTYTNLIYKYRDNLKITIQREYIGEVTDAVDLSKSVDTQVYRAFLLDMRDHNKEAKSPALDTIEQGDLSGMLQVEFQLIDTATEWLRSVSTGGSFRKTNAGDVLKTIIAIETQAMPIGRQEGVGILDMVKVDNLTKRDHVVVPHGMLLTQLPAFLQDKCGGIYNAGLGFYLQQSNWYVWPLYNTTRFEDTPNGLTVINIPENRFPGIERTYRETKNQLIVLATGQTQSIDTASNMQQAKGHGVRFADPMQMFESFGETANNITKIARGANVTEVKVKDSLTGFSHMVNAVKSLTGNLFSELSDLAFRQGQVTIAVWENSRSDLIYPGMPVKYMYEKDGSTYERLGVVIGTQHYTQMAGDGVTSRRYTTSSSITMFLGMDQTEE